MACKDDNIPGKVCFAGSTISADTTLPAEMLDVFKILCGEKAMNQLDDYDKTYVLAFRNTVMTSGHATFTFAKPYWPHGHVVQMVLQVLGKHGWVVDGGPNFGSGGVRWPGMVLRQIESV